MHSLTLSAHAFRGDEFTSIDNLLAFGHDQTLTESLNLPFDNGCGYHVASGPHSYVECAQQPGISSGSSTSDRMQHPVDVSDAQQLAGLSEQQLEDLARAVAEAQALARKKRLNASSTSAQPGHHNAAVEKVSKEKAGPQNKPTVFKCQHPGCNATFRQNKDRTRHSKNIHQGNTGYSCPIIDCVMGAGHCFSRSDKLRDHLRGKAVSDRTWRCVIPSCSKIMVTKGLWLDHIKEHDQGTREINRTLLKIHGYEEFYARYLVSVHLCARRGCPFGTDSRATMQEHMMVPHDGAHCPCPVAECQTVCADWNKLELHVASGHSFAARQASREALRNLGFNVYKCTFTCPIPSCCKVITRLYWINLYSHFKEHDFAVLLSAAESIVKLCRFVIGDSESYCLLNFLCDLKELSNNQLFATLAFTKAELSKVEKLEDLDRLCEEKGINLS